MFTNGLCWVSSPIMEDECVSRLHRTFSSTSVISAELWLVFSSYWPEASNNRAFLAQLDQLQAAESKPTLSTTYFNLSEQKGVRRKQNEQVCVCGSLRMGANIDPVNYCLHFFKEAGKLHLWFLSSF